MDADDIDLISRIYDAALDPSVWPELMLRLAHKLGAKGSFVFELRLDQTSPQVTARTYSSNYVPDVVSWYLKKFNEQEIVDQSRFAELSQQGNSVDLISDIYLRDRLSDLLAQPNIAAMTKYDLKHRAGALLNKDLVNVDRFALQYSVDHGPIRQEEAIKASLFLPHIAKVLGLSRPLESQMLRRDVFEALVRDIGQGVAILGPRGAILYVNREFERCMQEHKVFRKATDGTLQMIETSGEPDQAKRYHDLVSDDAAHGHFGARARREAIVVELSQPGVALFVEICPIERSPSTGTLGQGCRLVTVIDTSRQVKCDTARLQTFYQLSPTEASVLELIAQGRTNAEISEIRNRSPDTIKTQMKALMRKTNSQNRTDLVHMINNLSSAVTYKTEVR